METLARLYSKRLPVWNLFQLLAPLLVGLGVVAARGPARWNMLLLLILSLTILASIMLGGVAISYRYLHPFSFFGFIAVAVLGEAGVARRGRAKAA